MGEVWEALLHGPAGFRKRVALKLLSDVERPPDSLVREARLGGLLQHPHLVEVYALEEVDGRWVCAMELVEGGSLAAYIPLSPRAVVEVGLQVCAGLAHAHEGIGLVHLDLKPENLLLDVGGVKVADLGIARASGFAPSAGLPGTPGFMAPEYLRGESVDARADIYALGMVLIHLALGQPLHHPEAVDWLAPVARRCLAPDPNDRFRNMRELADALTELEVDGPGLGELVGQGHWAHSPAMSTAGRSGAETFLFDRVRPATNLAPAIEPMVGRDDAMHRLLAELREPGLVTVKGAGGLGKTRLAQEAGRAWHGLDGQPVWFVDLQAVDSRQGLLNAVAEILDVPLGAGAEELQRDQLGHALRGRGPLTLILDNFEQLVGWAGDVGTWLAAAPELRVIATSRERLKVAGERVFELEPLTVDAGVALLVARAAVLGRDIAGDPVLPELVARLDGMPLALELAGGRLGILSPSQVLDRLEQRFRLLADRGPRTARQRTMRAALDWSWDLLGEVERAALAQASVFAGSFSADAAEAVWDLPEGTWVLDVLESLVDRSLVAGRPGGRFGLYESTRAYAADKLEDPAAVQARHLAWFARFGTRDARRQVEGRHGHELRTELRPDLGNLFAAVRSAAAADHPDDAVSAAWAAWSVLELTGPWRAAADLARDLPTARGKVLAGLTAYSVGRTAEAGAAMEAALELDPAPEDRAEALRGIGRLAHDRGEPEVAVPLFHRALALHRQDANRSGEATTLCNLAVSAKQQDRFTEARTHYEDALALYKSIGTTRGEAATTASMAALDRDADRHDDAVAGLEKAIQLARRCGDRRVESVCLGNLGVLALDVNDTERAAELIQQTLVHRREVGDRRGEGVLTGTLGKVYGDEDQVEDARRCFEEAIAIHTEIGAEVWLGIAEGYLGQLELPYKGPEVARHWLRRAVDRLRGGHEQMRASFLCTLAEAEAMLGEHDQAERTLSDLMAIVRGSDRVRGASHAQCSLARVRAHQGRLDEARAALAKSEELEKDAGLGEGSRLRVDIDAAAELIEELASRGPE